MPKSKQAKAREFSKKAREEIIQRDNGQCIFCSRNYRMEDAGWYALSIKEIMHFIPRSQNGLGVAENGAVGCKWHHEMMDNGNQGNHREMLGIFEGHLRSCYPDWEKEKLVYSKWDS